MPSSPLRPKRSESSGSEPSELSWLRAAFDGSADGLFLVAQDGTIEKANETAAQRLGYTRRELIGMSVFELHPEADRPSLKQRFSQAIMAGEYRGDFVHQAKDGTLVPTEVNSRVLTVDGTRKFLSSAREMGQRQSLERDLKETEQRYWQLFEATSLAISVYSTEGVLEFCNANYAAAFGRPAAELEGRSAEELFRPEQVAMFFERRDEIVVSRQAVNYITQVELPRGPRWFQSTYNPLLGPGGEVERVQIISQDVTEKHEMAQRLQQSERLDALGLLAGGIAHDFNNLLAGLAGNLELARAHLAASQPDAALERLNRAVQVFDRARALTNQLRTFSRGGEPVRAVYRLGPRICEWAQFSLSGSDLALRMEVPEDLWPCECDLAQISQVIDNLLINARQASPAGGAVEVLAWNHEAEKPFVVVEVVDRGTGVPEEHRERIFDPFFTTKQGGTGLGLATSRSIAVQHGGRIELVTGAAGSRFSLWLPARPGAPLEPVPSLSASQRFHGWALVMDDEDEVRDTIGELLVASGFQVVRAKDGAKALAAESAARRRGRPLELAVLDLTIPGAMGGLETARLLREAGCRAVLLAVTGYSEDARQSLIEAGFAGVLAKPFSRRELTDLLATVLSAR